MDVGGVSTRLARQFGLVHQEHVEDLNVLVIGDSEVLPHLLLNLALCGVGALQGGVYLDGLPPTVTPGHVGNQFLLKPDDVGRPFVEALRERLQALAPSFDLQLWPADGATHTIPDVAVVLPRADGPPPPPPLLHCCRVYGQLGPGCVYVGHDPVEIEAFRPNVFTPALASLAGALLAQDVLRLSNTIRAVQVAEEKLRVSFRLRSEELGRWIASASAAVGTAAAPPIAARFKLGGEPIRLEYAGPGTTSDEGIFSMEMPDLLSRLITDSVEFVEEPLRKAAGIRPAVLVSLFGDERIAGSRLVFPEPCLPETLPELGAVVIGVGGLGTWVAGLLACVPSGRTRLAIVDCDERVEEHNLNRQVLYTSLDIGKPKVWAAQHALQAIRHDLDVHVYPLEVETELLRYVNRAIAVEYTPPGTGETDASVDRRDRLFGQLAGDLEGSQVVLTCLDNMRSRWVMNCATWLSGRTLVNGGVLGMVGTADFVSRQANDASLMTRYGSHLRTDTGKVQCGGQVPIMAIVTTNAVVASLQAALAVAAAAGLRPRHNRFYFNGASRLWYSDDLREPDGAPDSLGLAEVMEDLEGEPTELRVP